MKTRWIALGVVSMSLWATAAFAQAPETLAASGEDTSASSSAGGGTNWSEGWMFGIGPVGGVPLNNDCADCTSSPAFGMDFRVGRMFGSKLALMLDTHAAAIGRSDVGTYGVETSSVVQGVAALAVQWWPVEKFWLKGGIGHGQAEGAVTVVGVYGGTAELAPKETGFGMILGTGYDLYEGRTLIIDANLLYAGMHTETRYRGNLLIGLGFGWRL